jgi:tetratricopeptide (TPR) repeat protein
MVTNPKGNKSAPAVNDPNSLLIKGEQLFHERRYKESLEFCLKATEVDTHNARVWYARAQAEVMCLKYPEAVESCRKALELNPKNADSYFLLSFSYGVQGQFQEALESSTRGLEIDPHNKMVWFTRGQYLYALGRLEEALTSFSTALKLSPDSYYFKEVTEKIKKWLARDGKSTEQIEKVLAFLQQAGNSQMTSVYKESIKVDPRGVSKAFQKDYALAHLQNPEELLQQYEKTRVMDQPQIILEFSQKEFEFGRETWVEVTLDNKGKTAARDITFQFSSEVNMKHMDVTPEMLQKINIPGSPKNIDLDSIPELVPGSQIKKFVSLTFTKLGQIALEVKLNFTDIWNLKQTRSIIIWISVFKPGGQMPAINGYKVLWRLSNSESASIYIAQRNTDNLKTVIKIPHFIPEQTSAMMEFLNEVKQASKLVHPHVIRIYQCSESPTPWLAMEYMPKGTLVKQIGRLSLAEALRIAIALADALAFARSIRLSHRSISADNVLFDDKDNPKLTNWRIGPIIQKLHKSQPLSEIATTYYPPEKLIPGMGGLDWLTDTYQFGILLYEMLAGKAPFTGRGEELIAKIKLNKPLKPSDLNPDVIKELDMIVLHCMQINKKDRYQEPIFIKRDLEKVSRHYFPPQAVPKKDN